MSGSSRQDQTSPPGDHNGDSASANSRSAAFTLESCSALYSDLADVYGSALTIVKSRNYETAAGVELATNHP